MDNNETTRITENEAAYLVGIIESDYAEGQDIMTGDADLIVGTPVWDWSPAEGFGKSAGGIASSLSKKGLVHCEGSGEEATISMTLKGLEAIRAYIADAAPVPSHMLHLAALKRKFAQDAI
ncbi:MAG: hypothetical protein O7G84_01020 [Gammaproteobacteria bacterium]|nr:hypothetical protein [Gammaproteobacteria bacterium]